MGLLSDMAVSSTGRLHAARAARSDAELRERCAAMPRPSPLRLSDGSFDLIAEL
jgi:hypothetical protein